MKNSANNVLSNMVHYRTYAKFQSHLSRRETLEETINRNMIMHLDRFPKLSKDIIKAYRQIHELSVMPSMRSMQFGGEAILKNNSRIYNCSFTVANYERVFAEILFLLLSGTGVGYSVQKHHINQLPTIKKPREEGRYVAHDSIMGWADCVMVLFEGYFKGAIRPVFDLSPIRPKGSYLVTTGAKAPGPEPLRQMLKLVEEKLISAIGRRLTTLEVHDIICIIADCVLAGGIRRAALIALFDRDDTAMLTSKHGEWWLKHPYRARANNSAILPRHEVGEEEFRHIYDMCIKSNAGEPGFSWTNNIEMGYNPCHEIALNSNQFCNLTSVNLTGIKNEKDFQNRVYAATLLGTLQASYTDFPYLSDKWKQVTEQESLLGVSFTGVADATSMTAEQLQAGAKLALEVNEKYSKKIGINPAARVTAIKPEGTASCVVGSSSGIHARYSQHYLRRVRMNADDSLAKYLQTIMPELVEQDIFSKTGVVVTIPQNSPEGAIIRENESALTLLDRVNFYNQNWVAPGHRSGDNKHNVSCTINYKPEEIESLKAEMWKTRELYSGISLLPFDGGSYQQAPFEACSKEIFEKYYTMVKDIDLTRVIEMEDNTERMDSLACAGGVCEFTGESTKN
jgi:ribonucleoside-triphosphate reductase (thioredoxin)